MKNIFIVAVSILMYNSVSLAQLQYAQQGIGMVKEGDNRDILGQAFEVAPRGKSFEKNKDESNLCGAEVDMWEDGSLSALISQGPMVDLTGSHTKYVFMKITPQAKDIVGESKDQNPVITKNLLSIGSTEDGIKQLLTITTTRDKDGNAVSATYRIQVGKEDKSCTVNLAEDGN